MDDQRRIDLAAIEGETRFRGIRWVDETGSTNDDLRARAEAGEPEGLVLVADHQTAGRGRLDRTWEARPGDGLLVSVLLRPDLPPARWALVSSAVALAARDACRQVAGVEPAIKWPNDLLAPGGAKLAGILAVGVAGAVGAGAVAPAGGAGGAAGAVAPAGGAGGAAGATGAGGAVVVGMGINVHGGPPGSAWLDDLAGERVDRAALLEAWLRGLDSRAGDWDAVAVEYRRSCATVGRRVAVELAGGQSIEGVAEEIDASGRLVVRAGDGTASTLSVGDVTHLRW